MSHFFQRRSKLLSQFVALHMIGMIGLATRASEREMHRHARILQHPQVNNRRIL